MSQSCNKLVLLQALVDMEMWINNQPMLEGILQAFLDIIDETPPNITIYFGTPAFWDAVWLMYKAVKTVKISTVEHKDIYL